MSQNLQNVVKFQKFQLENLVDFEKCCKTHILLQKSEPIQPKTSSISKWAGRNRHLPAGRDVAPGPLARGSANAPRHPTGGFEPHVDRSCGWALRSRSFAVLTRCDKFLAGSFSAVSKRNFARKYAFDSVFQALQDLHPFAPLQSQNFRKKSV